jgi:hypothetical protein
MRNIVVMLMTGAIPIGIASADVHAASNHLKVTQIRSASPASAGAPITRSQGAPTPPYAIASTISKPWGTSPRGSGFYHRFQD